VEAAKRQGWAALYEQERQKIEDYLAQLAAEHFEREREKPAQKTEKRSKND
jgi:hypothetical protein